MSVCFRLGWHIEELLSHPRAGDVAHLPGWIELSSYQRQRLGLDHVDFVVAQVTGKAGVPAAVPLKLTTEARSKLTMAEKDTAASHREEYRTALSKLRVDLFVTFTAANFNYGKAYGLGRDLAHMTRADQKPDELIKSFELGPVGQIDNWLDELASLLPEHAARAVAKSLGCWQQAVTAASKPKTSSMPSNHLNEKASLRKQAVAALTPRGRQAQSGQTEPPAMESLVKTVARQGTLWRSILDGDKLCTDLLTPHDYLRAGDRLARHYAGLARVVLKTMPWLLVLPFSFLAVVVVLAVIPGSPVARTATGVAALAATLSGIWNVIRTRVAPIAMRLESPLWGSELNTAAADAVTIPPVGRPQETAFEQADRRLQPEA